MTAHQRIADPYPVAARKRVTQPGEVVGALSPCSKIEGEVYGRIACLRTTAIGAPDGRCECTGTNRSGWGIHHQTGIVRGFSMILGNKVVRGVASDDARVPVASRLSSRQVMLLLVLAALGPPLLSVALWVVSPPRGSFAATGAHQGLLLGLAWSTLLSRGADYRSRLWLGLIGLGATLLGASFILRHTSGMDSYGAALGGLFCAAQGLMTLLFWLSDTKHAVRPIRWSWDRFVVRAAPFVPPTLLTFFRDRVDLTIAGGILCALLIASIAFASWDRG